MTCNRFNEYNEHDPNSTFASHLEGCSVCQNQVAKIKMLEREVAAMTSELDLDTATWNAATRRKLVERKNTRREQAIWRPMVWAPIGATAIALLIIVLMKQGTDSSIEQAATRDVSAQAIGNDGQIVDFKIAQEVKAPTEARVLTRIDEDQVGLSASGHFSLLEQTEESLRLRLTKGSVACQVAPRKNNEAFWVLYRNYSVRVMGTRFSVSSDEDHVLMVSVIEGKVEVQGPNNMHEMVLAGETLKIGAQNQVNRSNIDTVSKNEIETLLSLDAPARPQTNGETQATNEEKPTGASLQNTGSQSASSQSANSQSANSQSASSQSANSQSANSQSANSQSAIRATQSASSVARSENLTDWQEMVIEGQFSKAETALVSHLKRSPADSDAWWLLATCRRKAGNWTGAVSAYNRVIATASPSRKDKARFRAGTILQEKQGEHSRSITYLGQYVKGAKKSKPLRAEAYIRLAKSYWALGQKKKALGALDIVEADYGNSPSCVKAKQLRKKYNH